MEISNNQRVGRGLELLQQGLAPYVKGKVPSEKVKAVLQENRSLSKNRQLKGKPVSLWDLSPLLYLMMHTWKEIFHKMLGNKGRALASELLEWRNDWAHSKPYTNKDTDRALDSAERMLRAVSATEQADKIDEMRKELIQRVDAEQAPRPKPSEENFPDGGGVDIALDRRESSMPLPLSLLRNGATDPWQIYQHYTALIGEIVMGEICEIQRRHVLMLHGQHGTGRGVELVLPRSEQLPNDWYRKGKSLTATVKEVQWDSRRKPKVIVSRKDPIFLESLLEQWLPQGCSVQRIAWESGEGVVIAMESQFWLPGETSYSVDVTPVYIRQESGESIVLKVALVYFSNQDAIRGSTDEPTLTDALSYICTEIFEPVTVIKYSSNSCRLIEQVFSRRARQIEKWLPPKPTVLKVPGEKEPPQVEVVVRPEEINKVLGRNGVNLRLASCLSGCDISVRILGDE